MGRKPKFDTEIKPWDQQEGETARAFEYFTAYRDMPPETRTISAVAARYGKSAVAMHKHCNQRNWKERVEAWDREQDRIAQIEAAREIAKVRRKQREAGTFGRETAIAYIEELKNAIDRARETGEPGDALAVAKLSEITQLLKTSAELERIGSGDSGEVVETRDGGSAPAVQIYLPDNGRGNEED